MRRKIYVTLLSLVVILATSALYLKNQFYGEAVEQSSEIFISNKDITSESNEILETRILPIIKHDWAFKFYAKYINLFSSVKPGRYKIEPNMSVIRVARMLKLGEQVPVNVTFNNIRTIPQLAGKISSQLDIDSLELQNYLFSNESYEKYGVDSTTMLSIFIPNTYELYWSSSAESFTDRMFNEYKNFWTKERLAKLKRCNLTRVEAITLASIVYEETKQRDEMPRVAGVYLNRLRIGMPLQADPTVKYALQDFAIKRVLNKHLEYDSPYNTYLYRGLPPSPISMPSIAAIDGVLNAEKHSYLYFCARPTFDGYHNFATSYSEHLNNAKAYTNELNRRKIK